MVHEPSILTSPLSDMSDCVHMSVIRIINNLYNRYSRGINAGGEYRARKCVGDKVRSRARSNQSH